MNFEPAVEIQCPSCGETLTTFLDLSQGNVQYIEDCQVCCRPMQLNVTIEDLETGDVHVDVTAVDV